MTKIKIFISHHKNSEILSSKILTPIQVNAELAETKFDMIGDNSGDNISIKNPSYCELTAQYWAWKNYEADYYGFMHYRRHFIFSHSKLPDDVAHMVHFPVMDSTYIKKCGLDDGTIEQFVEGYDCILPYPVNMHDFHQPNNRIQFPEIQYQYLENFDIAISIVKEIHPDFSSEVDEFINSTEAYWYNMYIMKKELFNRYNEWLYPILYEIEKRIDHSKFSIDEMRFIGFMAERLFSIFMIRIKKETAYKIRHLQISFIEDTSPRLVTPFPYYSTNNIPIVTASDDSYIPFVGTMLVSLLENSSNKYNFDIIIISKINNLLPLNVSRLLDMVHAYPNANVRFVDINTFISNIPLYTPRLFKIETYYRLFIPVILTNYDKVIYLDGDIIVNSDISEIFAVNLENNLIGAVKDSIAAGAMLSPLFNLKDYFTNTLKLKNPYNYFQAGVMVMNLKEFREQKLGPQMIEYASNHNCILVDQDVLNLYCQEKVTFLKSSWNVDCNKIGPEVAKCAPLNQYNDFLKARKDPKLFHYAGDNKPWNCSDLDYSQYFWKYAKLTPWYEYILMSYNKKELSFAMHEITKSFLSHPGLHPIISLRPESRIFNKYKEIREKIQIVLEMGMPYGTNRRKCGAVVLRFLKNRFPIAFM